MQEDLQEAEQSAEIRSLSSTRTVAKSALWNLMGRLGPLLVAVLATPRLVHNLGPSRWGVFTIALSLVGIFSIFDFGIGRALTRTISEMLAEGKRAEAAPLARGGIVALTILGTAGGLLMAAVAHIWVREGLRIPPELEREVLYSLYVLCLSAPLVILNSALWGVIAAFQEFRSANLINVPIMAMYYIGPLIVLHFYNSLVPVLATLVLCRVVMTVAYWRICVRAMPELKHARASFSQLKPLLRMGGWMTASNAAWPILTYVDRFVIASVLSAAATGYYSTPLDLVWRFNIISIAIMGTAYPAMAASYRSDPANTQSLFRRSIVSVTSILFPACLFCILLSHSILTIWLGHEFAAQSASVLRWLGVGILLTCVDSVVAGMLDAIGRADINAKFSIAEILVYIPLLIVLVRLHGIGGAAIAWAGRCLFDLVVRLWLVQRLYKPAKHTVAGVVPLLGGVTAVLFAAALGTGVVVGSVVAVGGAALVAILLWITLTAEERQRISAGAGRFLPMLQGRG